MMRFGVSVPIYGRAIVWVEAEDEDQAIAKAKSGDWSEEAEIEEWEVSIDACRGNICGRTMHNAVDAWLGSTD